MENVSSATQGVGQGDSGTTLDDASKLVENCSAREANTEVSAFATSGYTTSCAEFYSTRIASMMASKSEFETELEFRTAHSKVHWSELSHPDGASSSENQGAGHCQYFEKLQKDAHWEPFCSKVTNVMLGRKLGDGAQANIYEAQVTFAGDRGSAIRERHEFVVKLMKGDCALEDSTAMAARSWNLKLWRSFVNFAWGTSDRACYGDEQIWFCHGEVLGRSLKSH